MSAEILIRHRLRILKEAIENSSVTIRQYLETDDFDKRQPTFKRELLAFYSNLLSSALLNTVYFSEVIVPKDGDDNCS